MKAKGKELPSLLQQAITSIQSQTYNHINSNNNTMNSKEQLQTIQIILEAMNHISIASDLDYPQTSSLSNNPKERMVQLIQIMTTNSALATSESNPKKLFICPTSNAASIGKLCLPSLLNLFMLILKTVTKQSLLMGIDGDLIQSIMQTLSQCGSTCPSLLCADIHILTLVCQTLIVVGEKKELDPNVRLSALEALVTLCMVPDMKKILLDTPSLQTLCLIGDHSDSSMNGGVVGVCAELIMKGVDDDVDDWASEEVALQVRLHFEIF